MQKKSQDHKIQIEDHERANFAQSDQMHHTKDKQTLKSPNLVMDAVKAIKASNLKNESNNGSEIKPDSTPIKKVVVVCKDKQIIFLLLPICRSKFSRSQPLKDLL